MKPETLDKMVNLIYRADKEELDTLYQALRLQYEALRAQATTDALRELRVGDRVRLHGLRPKYMNGLTGVITKRRQVKFEVQLDETVYKAGRPLHHLIIPATALQKID